MKMERRNGDKTTLWTVNMQIPETGDDIRYRYFLGRRMSEGSPPLIHVIKWESHTESRRRIIGDESKETEEFGVMGNSIAISDGWIADPRLSEVRFTLFQSSSLEISTPGPYKIALQSIDRKGNAGEIAIDKWTAVFASVINDNIRRFGKKRRNNDTTGEMYTAKDLLSFRVNTAVPIENMNFRFYVVDAKTNVVLGTGDTSAMRNERAQGAMSIEVIGTTTKAVIGKLNVEYLIILPPSKTVQEYCTMAKTYARQLKRRGAALDIGHRGMGNSNVKMAMERENTIQSLMSACEKGADFVEFDVQLTNDEIPVLFHDFQLCVEGEDDGVLCEIAFKDLKMEFLHTATNLHHVYDLKMPDARTDYIPMVDRKEEAKYPARRPFPKLEDVLRSLPPYLGVNVEIKYPMVFQDGHHECEDFFDLNLYVDRILDVVAMYASDRRIIFSSFCPDTCIVLKSKQNRYPTFFLTQGDTVRYEPYRNPLTASSEMAINFALAEGLLGVCFPSEELMRTPEIIDRAIDNDLVSFVWGDDLDETENIEYMKEMGLDGVIYDRIDEHSPGKRNIFIDEM
jgi:glycerophosphocholine phosphodiesterase GPCPD1